jgi:hypothetical protein
MVLLKAGDVAVEAGRSKAGDNRRMQNPPGLWAAALFVTPYYAIPVRGGQAGGQGDGNRRNVHNYREIPLLPLDGADGQLMFAEYSDADFGGDRPRNGCINRNVLAGRFPVVRRLRRG